MQYKRILTLILTTACSLGAAQAADVSVSGMIDTYLESYTAGNSTNVRLSSGGAGGGSRVTFKAQETIDPDLRAFTRLEMGILVDSGETTGNRPDYLFERESVVGIAGRFGTLSMGRQYTPHFLSLPMNEATGQSLGSAIGAFGTPGHISTNGIGLPGGARAATTRMDNSVVYTSPAFAGLSASFMAALGEQTYRDNGMEKLSTSRGNFFNLGLRYVNGPVTGNLSLAKWNNPVVAGVRLNDVWFESLSAAWDLRVTKLSFNIVGRQSDDPLVPNLWAVALGSNTPAGIGRVMATIGYLTQCEQKDADGLSWGVRYDHPLSPRTKVYTGLFGVQNQKNASFVLAGGGGSSKPPAIATEDRGLANHTVFVGINHLF